MTVAWTVTDGPGDLLMTVNGRLGLNDVSTLRLHLMKCLAEQPEAVLIDLDGVRVEQPLALAVFTAAARQSRCWPGIPLLLCTSTAETRAMLRSGAYRRLPLFRDVTSARQHIGKFGQSLPSLSDDILPIEGAGRHARNVATDACLRWGLPDMVGPACLIANELIANVTAHANTMATLRISLRQRHLALAVEDGSAQRPVLRPGGEHPGRGLQLVRAMSVSWGWLPTEGGKVVWATLRR